MRVAENRYFYLNWLDRIGRYLIAAIFLSAAIPKLLNLNGFAEIIGAYGILPSDFLLPAAVLLVILEIVFAFTVFFNSNKGKLGSLALLLVFIIVLSYAVYAGLDIDCGCFGPEDPERQAFSGLRTALVRDVFMVSVLLYSLWFCTYKDRIINQ